MDSSIRSLSETVCFLPTLAPIRSLSEIQQQFRPTFCETKKVHVRTSVIEESSRTFTRGCSCRPSFQFTASRSFSALTEPKHSSLQTSCALSLPVQTPIALPDVYTDVGEVMTDGQVTLFVDYHDCYVPVAVSLLIGHDNWMEGCQQYQMFRESQSTWSIVLRVPLHADVLDLAIVESREGDRHYYAQLKKVPVRSTFPWEGKEIIVVAPDQGKPKTLEISGFFG